MKRKRRTKKRRLRVVPGQPPGTIAVDPESPRPELRIFIYDEEKCVEEAVTDPGQLRERLSQSGAIWVNVDGLGDSGTMTRLGDLFGLHRLVLEDVVHVGQRAKLEVYDEHLFVVLRMMDGAEFGQGEQVSLVLGKNYVLTFQERPGDCFEPVRTRLREGKGRIRRAGADYLAYALVDAVVDGYFPVLEQVGDRLDAIEDEIYTQPGKDSLMRTQELKTILRELRRFASAHRDVTTVLLHEDTPFVVESTEVYLRDCADHAIRVTEMIDSYREATTDLMGAYLSSASNRLNEVMKVLTIVASIFIPLSFLAGIYGMNFDRSVSTWNMPELAWPWGYPILLSFMAAVAGGMLLFFKRRGWLG